MWREEHRDGIRVRELYRDPVTGEQKRVSVKAKGRSKQAIKEAEERLRQKIEDALRTPEHYRFSQVIKVYNAEQSLTCRPSTCHRNACTLNTMLKYLGDFEMDKVTAGYIKERLVSTGAKPVTINQYIKRIKGFLRWAYQNDYLPSTDVFEKLTYLPDAPHRLKIKDKYLEPEELHALVESMAVPRWRCLTEFLALSGLRIGEAIALDKTDIRDGYIHVTKTAQINNKNMIGDAKTLDSVRKVFVQDELAACLRRWESIKNEQREAVDIEAIDDRPLFVGLNGQRIQYAAYCKYLKERSRAVLGREISPHALRHTHTSLLAGAGVPLDVISRRLGHSDSRVTRDIYFHVTKVLELRDASQIIHLSLLPPETPPTLREPLKIKGLQ